MQQIPWSTAPAVVSRVNFCCWWIFTSWRHGFSLQDLRWYTPYVVLHSSHFDAHRKIAYFQRYSPPSLLINHGDCDGAKHRSTTQTSIDCWEYARYYIEGEREVSIEALGQNWSSCVSICRCVLVAPCLLHHSASIAHSFFLSVQTFTVSLSFRLCVELVNWGKLRLCWLDRKRVFSCSVRWCVRLSFVACLPLICTPPLLTRCLFALQVIELCMYVSHESFRRNTALKIVLWRRFTDMAPFASRPAATSDSSSSSSDSDSDWIGDQDAAIHNFWEQVVIAAYFHKSTLVVVFHFAINVFTLSYTVPTQYSTWFSYDPNKQ